MKTSTIKTKKLVLRALNNDELEKRSFEQSDVLRQKAYADMLAGCNAEAENRLWYTAWEVTLKESGELVGDVFFKGKPVDDEAEIAYILSDKFKDSAEAADAINELAVWGFSNGEDLYFVSVWVDSQSEALASTLDDGDFSVIEENESMLKFERVRAETSWLPLGLCFGTSLGLSFGLLFDNLALGIGIGLPLSVAIGLLIDSNNKKKRSEILRKHKGEEPEDEE